MNLESTPKTGFNILLVIEALIAICVVLAGVVWAWSSVERRVTALEEERHRDAQSREAKQRDQRIEQIEQSLQEIRKLLPQK